MNLAGRAQVLCVRGRVGESDLEQGALESERRAQLVRRVRDEPALCGERGLQATEQLVKEGFQVLNEEWWHFDYQDWKKYAIGNKTFEELK